MGPAKSASRFVDTLPGCPYLPATERKCFRHGRIGLRWPRRLVWPRTPGFHPGDRGSNPLGVTTSSRALQALARWGKDSRTPVLGWSYVNCVRTGRRCSVTTWVLHALARNRTVSHHDHRHQHRHTFLPKHHLDPVGEVRSVGRAGMEPGRAIEFCTGVCVPEMVQRKLPA